jgi:hypothetical protein
MKQEDQVLYRTSDILKIVCSAFAILVFSGCVKPYLAPATTASYNYLVVDGFINAGNDSTSIYLSRTGPLSDSTQIQPETHATVVIEGNNGSSIPLYESSPGSYSCGPFNPSNNAHYRLDVTTSIGSQYESDYVTPMFAPAIDSITWANTSVDQSGQSGVTIYVNAHNNNNASRYYRWVYYETWEFHPAFESFIDDSLQIRKDPEALYTCWRSDTSTNVIVGSTVNLSQNIISQVPLEFLPDSSWKLSVEYSLFVQQQAIDENTYNFFEILQKNTEQLGSIFAPQPASVNGNIHCLNHPSETVIGFMYSTSTTSERIFIKNSQVTGWYPGPNSCVQYGADQSDYIAIPLGLIIPTNYAIIPGSPAQKLLQVTIPICADCRLSGTNVQPAFWPN